MNRTDNPTPTLTLDTQADETRMRRALGLQGGTSNAVHQQRPEQARQRHRFAQDGSVPVVMLNRSGDHEAGGAKERITALEASLEAERTAHAATRRTLQELQASHQALQTRLAHTELAHSEAMAAAERRSRRQAEEPAPAIMQARPKADPVEATIAGTVSAEHLAERPVRRPRPGAATLRQPKPVRWWIPGYRAKK